MGVGPLADDEFCGQLNQSSPEIHRPIVTDNPRLVLVFSSIDAMPGTGFKATYQFLTGQNSRALHAEDISEMKESDSRGVKSVGGTKFYDEVYLRL